MSAPPVDVFSNLELERTVLGVCLLDGAAIPEVAAGMEGVWGSESHDRLFKAIVRLQAEHGAVSIATLIPEASKIGIGSPEVVRLFSYGVTSSRVDADVSVLRELAHRRRLVKVASEMVEGVRAGEDWRDVVVGAQSAFDEMGAGGQAVRLNEQVAQEHDHAMLVRSRQAHENLGTGYEEVDSMLVEGLAPGQVSVCAGRPGTGKSSFSASVVRSLCLRGVPTLWLTYEMSAVSQYDRMIVVESGIDFRKVVRPRYMDEAEKELVWETKERIRTWPVMWDDRRAVWWADVVGACSRSVRHHGARVVVVDLFDRLRDFADPIRQHQVMAARIKEAADLALRLGLHVMLVAQINRGGKDIKGTGAFEEVADLVFSLQRVGDDEDRPEDEGPECVVRLRCNKQRNGPTFVRSFLFEGRRFRFMPLTGEAAGPQNRPAPRRAGGRHGGQNRW